MAENGEMNEFLFQNRENEKLIFLNRFKFYSVLTGDE